MISFLQLLIFTLFYSSIASTEPSQRVTQECREQQPQYPQIESFCQREYGNTEVVSARHGMNAMLTLMSLQYGCIYKICKALSKKTSLDNE